MDDLAESAGPASKKAKLAENGLESEKQEELKNFSGFKISKILSESSERKSVVVEGTFEGGRRSVVVLERLPLREEILPKILNESVVLKKELVNDIYGQYEVVFPGDEQHGVHSLKANVVLPATEKHVAKYSDCSSYIINETPQLYQFLTLPFIESERFSIEWVYNILDHKKESERIIYEDPDPETGFIIIPDFKWSGKQIEDLYVIGIVHTKNLKSIRSLRRQHLPLLRKLWMDGTAAIAARFGVPRSQIRAYFHYQPSYFHLHVHYTHVQYGAPGISADKAHLLPAVIHNLERDSAFYANAMLPFVVRETSNLFKAYKSAGYDFGNCDGGSTKAENFPIPLDFLRQLGRAKHEPCGEHWNISYGDSAWRMALIGLCLRSPKDKLTVAKMALSSAFTCIGGLSTDQCSEWPSRMEEVRQYLAHNLPLDRASKLYHLFFQHVSCRRKACVTADCHKVYRQVMELEEAFLLFEELQKDDSETDNNQMKQILVKKISEMPFDGIENNVNGDKVNNAYAIINFIFKISALLNLKRTGWVRSKVRDPERVSGHMFRMGLLAALLEEEDFLESTTSSLSNLPNDCTVIESLISDVTNSAMIISLVHDLAECVVGDITPQDNVSAVEKHRMEVEAMEGLVSRLTPSLGAMFMTAFYRYENANPDDKPALLTKDLDKFDMVMQAFEYEEKEKRFGDLEDFFVSTSNPELFKHPIVNQWNSELRLLRKQKIHGKQISGANDSGN